VSDIQSNIEEDTAKTIQLQEEPVPIPQARDEAKMKASLAEWLNTQPGISDAQVTELDIPDSSGFSNETLLGELKWHEPDGKEYSQGIVIRMRPTDYAIFPEYNMAVQYRSLQSVRASSDVPVPEVYWVEDTGEVLGQPFFLMERLWGRVPSDNPPYFEAGFVKDATPDQQRALYTSSLETMAKIHAIDWRAAGFLEFLDQPKHGPTGFAQQLGYYRHYIDWASEGRPQPTVEAAMEWLTKNDPTAELELVVNWGDARPSNMMYGDDFRPIGVFDWEMATIGPKEVDLGWFISMNEWQSRWSGFDWLPGFLSEAETVECYERASGKTVNNIDYFKVWGSLRFCVVMIQIISMQIKYGAIPAEYRFLEYNNPATHQLASYLGIDPPGELVPLS